MVKQGMINISHYECNTNLLGPYTRFVIWVHGCCFNCKDCLAENAKNGPFKTMPIEQLGDLILAEDIEGITISGGEPFLQVNALVALINYVRKKRDLGVIIYTGFVLEEIKEDEEKVNLLNLTDILIDGQYIKELDDGRAYVGSSNQKIHRLTERYIEVAERYYNRNGRKAEIKIEKDKVILIGVPSEEVLNVWENLKEKARGAIDDFGD